MNYIKSLYKIVPAGFIISMKIRFQENKISSKNYFKKNKKKTSFKKPNNTNVKHWKLYTLLNHCSAIPHNVIIASY